MALRRRLSLTGEMFSESISRCKPNGEVPLPFFHRDDEVPEWVLRRAGALPAEVAQEIIPVNAIPSSPSRPLSMPTWIAEEFILDVSSAPLGADQRCDVAFPLPAFPSTASVDIFDYVDALLMDTGAGKDLADQRLAKLMSGHVVKMPRINFSTANGPFASAKGLKAYLSLMDNANTTPYLMNKCPPVLSVGLRCRYQGFHFI